MTIRSFAVATLMLAASPVALAGSAHAQTMAPEASSEKSWWPKNLDLTALRQNEAQ